MAPRAHGYIGAVTAKPRGRRAITSRADIVAFGRFRLDRKLRVLLCDGQRVPVGAKALDLLECLIDGRAAVMSKQSILACVWADRVVGDGNLPVQVHILRTALAPHGGDGLILGVQNGYRFVGEVAEPAEVVAHPAPLPEALQEPAPAPEPAPPIRDWQRLLAARRRGLFVAGWMVALVAVVALVLATAGHDWSAPALPRLSIAVLPFRDRSDGAAHASLADAITDDLTTDLSHIPGSVVVARASVDALRNPFAAAAEVGNALKVRYLLTGSIRAEEAVYRVNADGVEAASGRQIWSARFDTPIGSASETQTNIVRRIASAFDAALTLYVGAQALRDGGKAPPAEDLFIEARAIFERNDSKAGFEEAQALLEKAVRLKPGYGDGLALLGLTLVLKTRSTDDRDAQADLARAADVIAAALEVSGPSALAMSAKARLSETNGDCQQGEADARAALALDADAIDALAVLARCAANAGRFDEAAGYEQAALQLNPFSIRTKPRLLFMSEIRLYQGRYADAIDLGQQALVGDEAPQPGAEGLGRAEFARLMLIGATQLSGDMAGAAKQYRAYSAIWPNRSVWRISTYEPVRMSKLPAYGRFLEALHAAGMPTFADPHAPVLAADSPGKADSEFGVVPMAISGVKTLDTLQVAAELSRGSATVIDVGIGAAVPVGAAFVADAGRLEAAVDAIVEADRTKPVILMSSGCYGTDAYAAVLRLKAAGFRHVSWFRGGEEAWAAAGQPQEDRRPEY